MRDHRLPSILAVVLALTAAVATPAAADVVGVYTEGIYAFDYATSGTYGGTFEAEGIEFQASGTFDTEQLVACGGFFDKESSKADKTTMTLYAAYRNPDETVDAAVLWVSCEGNGIPSGSYTINLLQPDNMFVFLDNIEAFEPPSDWTDPAALAAWAAGLSALHALTSTSGTITITTANAGIATGSFSGSMADANNWLFPPVDATNGSFDFQGHTVGDVPATLGRIKQLFR